MHVVLAAPRSTARSLRVAAAMRQGRTVAQIQALHIADSCNRRPNNFISPESFVETVRRSLRNPPADHHR
jgi:hypothetical protein